MNLENIFEAQDLRPTITLIGENLHENVVKALAAEIQQRPSSDVVYVSNSMLPLTESQALMMALLMDIEYDLEMAYEIALLASEVEPFKSNPALIVQDSVERRNFYEVLRVPHPLISSVAHKDDILKRIMDGRIPTSMHAKLNNSYTKETFRLERDLLSKIRMAHPEWKGNLIALEIPNISPELIKTELLRLEISNQFMKTMDKDVIKALANFKRQVSEIAKAQYKSVVITGRLLQKLNSASAILTGNILAINLPKDTINAIRLAEDAGGLPQAALGVRGLGRDMMDSLIARLISRAISEEVSSDYDFRDLISVQEWQYWAVYQYALIEYFSHVAGSFGLSSRNITEGINLIRLTKIMEQSVDNVQHVMSKITESDLGEIFRKKDRESLLSILKRYAEMIPPGVTEI